MIWLLFVLIQLVSLVLSLAGVPVIALAAFFMAYHPDANGKLQWSHKWLWIWGNQEDGISYPGRPVTWWSIFLWSALRNSCNNLRYVPGVSKVGRPLWIRNWTFRGKVYYAKSGWLQNGYPVISAGAGRW